MANTPKSRVPARSARPGSGTKPNDPVPRISATVDAGVAGANRKERKDEARRQREALIRKQGRRRYYRIGAVALAAVVALVLVLVLVVFKKSPPPVAFDQSKLPGLITSQDITAWQSDPNIEDLAARITDLGLPALTATEQLAFHIHQELQIFIDGQLVSIPANIGIDTPNQRISIIHVHQHSPPDNVIHVESPVQKTFTLGDFFGVWGMYFLPTQIGGFKDVGGKTLKVFVNGEPFQGNPTDVPLNNHSVIVVTYGTTQELPTPIPGSFDWASSTAG